MLSAQANIDMTSQAISNSLNLALSCLSTCWFKLNNIVSIYEIGIIIGIGLISYMLQKGIQKRYLAHIVEEEGHSWSQRFVYVALSFAAPFIAFVLLTFAMSISAIFTSNLEIYKISIKLTLIWFVWILADRIISDLFVRWVVSCTLIPLFVFSTFGLSAPVLNYLDSLGFTLAGIHLSVFLMLKGLLVATCLFWFARLICQNVLNFIESQKKITPEIRDLAENLFQIFLYTAVVLITLDLVGIDLKSLALIGGAVGIGIGLGLQKIAANFISGIIILFEQNVKVGHFVEIAGDGNPGWIRHLGARAAVIDTGDGKELLIPNEELLTKTIIDWTSRDRKARIDLHIKVSFNSDLEKAKQIMLEAILSHPLCSKRTPPSCFLEKFTDNGARFLLQFWVDDLIIGKMDMQNDVLLTIWRRFSEENIEHPSLNPNNLE